MKKFSKRQTVQRTIVNLVAVLIIFAVLYVLQKNGIIGSYPAGVIAMIGINVMLAVSLNLTVGFLGQLILGHAAFMSVGAYTAAIFTSNMSSLPINVSLPIGLLLGGLLSAVVGLLIGLPALRLRGDYIAIITLGFGEIIRIIIRNLEITGGARGLMTMPSMTLMSRFVFIFVCAVITIFAIIALVRSRHGRAIISIREDEIAAEAAGIPTTYYKTLAFVIAAFFAGIAGGLYAHQTGVLKAEQFDFNRSVEIVIMVVMGGMGSITGSVLAAIVLTILPEALRNLPGALKAVAELRMLFYSLALILIMIMMPKGILGRYEFSLYRILQRFGLFKDKRED